MHRLRDHADVETAGSLGDVVIFRIRGLPLLPLLPTFPQHREALLLRSGSRQRLVDLLSRDASAAGSRAPPGALRPTAHHFDLRLD